MASHALFDNCHSDSPSLYGSALSFGGLGFEADEVATNDFEWVDGYTVSAEESLWYEDEETRYSRVYGSEESDPAHHEDYYFEKDYLCRDKPLEGATLNDEPIRYADERFTELALRFAAAEREYYDEAELEELLSEEAVEEPGFRTGVRYNQPLTWYEVDRKDHRWYYCREIRGSNQQRAPRWQQRCRTNRLSRTTLRDLSMNDNDRFDASDFLNGFAALQ